MKFTYLSLIILFSFSANAQFGSNCSEVPTTIQCPADLTLCISETTDLPVVSVSSTLPNLEYIITDVSQNSTANTGPSIIAFDADGVFAPTDYNITTETQLELIPVNYDLQAIQNLADDFLNGIFLIFPCCSLIPDVCTTLNSNGIFAGSDITSLEQILPILTNPGELISVQDVTSAVDSANLILNDPSTPADCGGGSLICYGIGNTCTFDVIADNLVFANPDHSVSTIEKAGNSIISTAIVGSALNVEYEAAQIICLDNDFTVDPGGEFSAIILPCQ